MNYYRRFMGDYAKKTAALSLAEHGAYTVLLDEYYSTETPLPAEHEALYRLCRAMTKGEQDAVRAVADRFFPLEADGLRHNERADEEIAKAQATIAKQRESAVSGGRSKWGSSADGGTATRRERMRAAREKGEHTEIEWEALLDACGNKCVKCGSEDRLFKDHIKPIYQGGSDAIENLQPMCKSCNSSKGPDCSDHRPDHWRTAVDARVLATTAATDRRLQPPTSNSNTNHQPQGKGNVGLAPDGSPPKPDLRKQAAFVIDALNRRTGRNYGLNGANADHVVARLKDGATVDLCLAVVDLKVGEWSGDAAMAKYLRPETLFNRTKFATYSGEVGAKAPEGERKPAL